MKTNDPCDHLGPEKVSQGRAKNRFKIT